MWPCGATSTADRWSVCWYKTLGPLETDALVLLLRTRSGRRLRLITLTRMNERGEDKTIRPFIEAADPLRRRGRAGGHLHRDHLPRPCVLLLDEASRLSVVVNECETAALPPSLPSPPLPAPLLPAASHNHRLLLPPHAGMKSTGVTPS